MAVAGTSGAVHWRNPERTGSYVGPTAGEKNPLGQTPEFFHRLIQLVAARRFDIAQTERLLAPGFFRRWAARIANANGAPPSFSWSKDSFSGPAPVTAAVTSPLRYLTGNVSTLDGNQLSNPDDRAAIAFHRSAGQPPLIRAGQTPLRPTVRSRLVSFGSRVPPLNPALPSEDVANG